MTRKYAQRPAAQPKADGSTRRMAKPGIDRNNPYRAGRVPEPVISPEPTSRCAVVKIARPPTAATITAIMTSGPRRFAAYGEASASKPNGGSQVSPAKLSTPSAPHRSHRDKPTTASDITEAT